MIIKYLLNTNYGQNKIDKTEQTNEREQIILVIRRMKRESCGILEDEKK